MSASHEERFRWSRYIASALLLLTGIYIFAVLPDVFRSLGLICGAVAVVLMAPELAGFGDHGKGFRRVVSFALLAGAYIFIGKVGDVRQALEEMQRIIAADDVWETIQLSMVGLFLFLAAVIGFAPDLMDLFFRRSGFLYYTEAGSVLRDYGQATKCAREEDWWGAARAYRAYLDEDPTDQRAMLELARVYTHRLNEKQMALYWYDKILASPKASKYKPMVYHDKVELYCRYGDLPAAKSACTEMMERYPDSSHTRSAERFMQERMAAHTAEIQAQSST